jgi:hypothetical protein
MPTVRAPADLSSTISPSDCRDELPIHHGCARGCLSCLTAKRFPSDQTFSATRPFSNALVEHAALLTLTAIAPAARRGTCFRLPDTARVGRRSRKGHAPSAWLSRVVIKKSVFWLSLGRSNDGCPSTASSLLLVIAEARAFAASLASARQKLNRRRLFLPLLRLPLLILRLGVRGEGIVAA